MFIRATYAEKQSERTMNFGGAEGVVRLACRAWGPGVVCSVPRVGGLVRSSAPVSRIALLHSLKGGPDDPHPILEVLEVDILWPRWVARIGVTRATPLDDGRTVFPPPLFVAVVARHAT